MGFPWGDLWVRDWSGLSTPEDPDSEMVWFGQRRAADAAAGWMWTMVMVMMKPTKRSIHGEDNEFSWLCIRNSVRLCWSVLPEQKKEVRLRITMLATMAGRMGAGRGEAHGRSRLQESDLVDDGARSIDFSHAATIRQRGRRAGPSVGRGWPDRVVLFSCLGLETEEKEQGKLKAEPGNKTVEIERLREIVIQRMRG
ncbi:hypothetical protein PVAR5_4915 [Paecilomyces variotii No. 5]|uniref:Uncharacterized protein n=1 Tax=Byssochlamys spectabilis (strain No. 5 / NBRC 109023) TaxID=1356009 RepID=V5I101_BYSSN|nr:hypothetical protein PVAR5_4915 [Paecilomyces variotii No. 5]